MGWELGSKNLEFLGSRSVLSFSHLSLPSLSSPSLPASLSFYRSLNTAQPRIEPEGLLSAEHWDTGWDPDFPSLKEAEWLGAGISGVPHEPTFDLGSSIGEKGTWGTFAQLQSLGTFPPFSLMTRSICSLTGAQRLWL